MQITMETLERLYHCMREIKASEKLLADMKAERERPFATRSVDGPTLQDAFGRKQHLELGIPSGSNSHRIFQVAPQLAESVIRAHIAKKQAELIEANEQARVELETPPPVAAPNLKPAPTCANCARSDTGLCDDHTPF